MNHHFITIEGNIGAGKTTLAHLLAKHFNGRLILEQFADNPFLPKFYENPQQYAFPLELFFMAERFKQLKELYPHVKLHALGPPEVAHITKLERSTHREVLIALRAAGLDSLPGAGAEILVDRVRRLISKGKCGAQEWLDIMHQAHN